MMERRLLQTPSPVQPPWQTLPYRSQNPEEKIWTCPRCGVVPPNRLHGGWYVRRLCLCELQEKDNRDILLMQQHSGQQVIEYTYTWLGREWREQGLARRTFATFQQERQPEAYGLAQAFARSPKGILALYGSPGTGKTHLLAAIANEIGAQGTRCLYASAVYLFGAIQDRISQGEDYHVLFKQAIGTPLFLLDDIDKLKPSEFREEVLYKLLNGRINESRPLAISSNGTPAELEHWVGRAGRSRLMQGLIPVEMNGPDYRLEITS